MFRVTDRRWKVRLEPHRAKGRWEDADSDSDYSGDEMEETKEERDKVRHARTCLKCVV